MKNFVVRKDNKLLINNRTFLVTAVWFLGNKPTKYELQEMIGSKEIGPVLKKESSKIDTLIEEGKIKIEK